MMNQPSDPSAAQIRRPSRWSLRVSSLLALGFILTCLLFGILFLKSLHQSQLDQLHSQLQNTRNLASEYLATDRQFLQLLAEQAASGRLDSQGFQDRAAQYVADHPYLINISWADAGFVIRDTAPLEPNRQLLGLPLDLPEPKRASRLARETGQPAYTRPFVVLQGEPAFEVYLPITRDGQFLGTLGGIYSSQRFSAALKATIPDQQQFSLTLAPSATPDQTSSESPEVFMPLVDSLPIDEVPGLQLHLQLPMPAPSPMVVALLALAMLLGGGLWLTSLRLNRELVRRQAAEADLYRSEQLYQSIYTHSGVGIVLADSQRTILQANPAFAGMLGYAPEHLVGRSIMEISHPDEMGTNLAMIQAADRGERDTYSLKKRYIHRQGHSVWGQLTVTCLRNQAGTPDYFLAMVNDITEQQQAERKLRDSEQQFRTLFQSMAQGVFYRDADGRVSSVNRAACDIFGMNEAELIGKTLLEPCWQVIREDGSEFPAAERPSLAALATGESIHNAIAGIRNPQTGAIRWLTISAIPEFRPGDERPFRVFVTLHDFTEQKLSQQRTEASEASYRVLSNQFQTLLNAIPDPMYMLDPDGSIHWHNQASEELFGAASTSDQARFKRFYGQLSVDSEVARNCFDSGLPQEQRSHLENQMITLRCFPVKNDQGDVIRVLMQVYDETAKLRQQETLLRTGQLAAIGELAAGVAHEINNPINGVINYAQILCRWLDPQGEEHRMAQRILQEGERVARIASSLLAYTREKSAVKHPIPLSEIVSEVLLLAGTKMRNEGIRIILEIPPKLPELLVSPAQIQQVFLNLLSNARYALKAKDGSEPDKTLTISAKTSDSDKLLVTIRDNGVGIAETILLRVTAAFFTTKPARDGTGLGLSICNDILALHGSQLSITSRAGEFTSVSFELPCLPHTIPDPG